MQRHANIVYYPNNATVNRKLPCSTNVHSCMQFNEQLATHHWATPRGVTSIDRLCGVPLAQTACSDSALLASPAPPYSPKTQAPSPLWLIPCIHHLLSQPLPNLKCPKIDAVHSMLAWLHSTGSMHVGPCSQMQHRMKSYESSTAISERFE